MDVGLVVRARCSHLRLYFCHFRKSRPRKVMVSSVVCRDAWDCFEDEMQSEDGWGLEFIIEMPPVEEELFPELISLSPTTTKVVRCSGCS